MNNESRWFRLGLVQMDITWAAPERNLNKAGEMLDRAAERGCSMAVLPELWSTALCGERLGRIVDSAAAAVMEAASGWARTYAMTIAAGSIACRDAAGRICNTSLIFDPSGDVLGRYRKVHLFGPMDEGSYVWPGDGFAPVPTNHLNLGPLICYDIRFPEAARKLALLGADMLVVPANFPDPRCDIWQILLQARAIENQVFVAGVNRVGADPKFTYFGHSMIIAPDGRVLAAGEREEALLVADIDPDLIGEVRSAIPALEDRRPELYSMKEVTR